MTDSPAMIAALAEIEAMSARNEARRARIEADARMVFLTRVVAENQSEISEYGLAGLQQLIGGTQTASAWRRRRARTLLHARRAKLFNGAGIARFLHNASHLRGFEKHPETVPEVVIEGNVIRPISSNRAA